MLNFILHGGAPRFLFQLLTAGQTLSEGVHQSVSRQSCLHVLTFCLAEQASNYRQGNIKAAMMAKPSQQLKRTGKCLLVALMLVQQALAFQSFFSATSRVAPTTIHCLAYCTTLGVSNNSAIDPSIDPQVNDQRYSASDWWHNMQSLPRSTVLREIKSPVSAIVLWSAFVSMLNLLLSTKWNVQLKLSSIPHSLLVSSLALLLVFRTNSAYQRFAVRLMFDSVK